MSDEEKKVKLDELPDEGSEPVKPRPVRPKKKEIPEPRITKLKTLDDPLKVEMMKQSWHFDVRNKDYTWVGFIAILLILEFSPIYSQYLSELELMDKNSMGLAGSITRDFTFFLEGFLRHPSIFVIFTPLIFSFSKQSDFYFNVTFDGIHTVRKIIPSSSTEIASRVFIKWKEIERVEKTAVEKKAVLRLYAKDEAIGDLIWHLETDKKRAINLLLRGMINPTHPLRVFLENEKELK